MEPDAKHASSPGSACTESTRLPETAASSQHSDADSQCIDVTSSQSLPLFGNEGRFSPTTPSTRPASFGGQSVASKTSQRIYDAMHVNSAEEQIVGAPTPRAVQHPLLPKPDKNAAVETAAQDTLKGCASWKFIIAQMYFHETSHTKYLFVV